MVVGVVAVVVDVEVGGVEIGSCWLVVIVDFSYNDLLILSSFLSFPFLSFPFLSSRLLYAHYRYSNKRRI